MGGTDSRHGGVQWLTTLLCVLPTQVKATSNALKSNVLNVKGGEHLLMLAGFKPQVCVWGEKLLGSFRASGMASPCYTGTSLIGAKKLLQTRRLCKHQGRPDMPDYIWPCNTHA